MEPIPLSNGSIDRQSTCLDEIIVVYFVLILKRDSFDSGVGRDVEFSMLFYFSGWTTNYCADVVYKLGTDTMALHSSPKGIPRKNPMTCGRTVVKYGVFGMCAHWGCHLTTMR